MNIKVSESEYRRRMNIIREAIHSQLMEGDHVSSDNIANLKAFARGEMTMQEVENYLDQKWNPNE